MAKRKTTVLEELSRVRYIGPKLAEVLYDDHGIRSIADIVEFARDGNLTDLKGVGDSKASTIMSSAERIAEADGLDVEDSEAKSTQKEQTQAPAPEAKATDEPAEQRTNGAAPPESTPRTNGRAPEPTPPPEPSPSSAATGTRTARTSAAPSEPATTPPSTRPTAEARSLEQRFIDTLRCPACGHDRFEVGANTLTCQACQRQFNFKRGTVDLAPPSPPERSLSQKVMESRLYTRLYEEFMRPRLTSIVSSRPMREEYRLSADFLDLDGDIRLLDIGCGTANFTRYFAQRIGLAEASASDSNLPLVVGMDLSWPMLENARRNIEQENLEGKVFLLRGDGTRIPVRRGAYNRVHCAGTLHLMSDIDEGLRNFARVLEPQGICVIDTFILGKGLLRRLFKRMAEFPTRFHWFSRDELLKRIERAGFEILDNSIAGDAITVKARRI